MAFVTDASADVPLAEREVWSDVGPDAQGGITWVVLPERWHLPDGTDVRDVGDADSSLAAVAMDRARRADVSEPTWDAFCDVYARLRDVERVFSIHSPASVTGAITHAREAAGAFPNVRVIEADVTGIGLGLLASLARDRALDGATLDEVERFLRCNRARVHMLLVPDRFDPTITQRGLTTRLLSRGRLHTNSVGAGLGSSRRLRTRRATVAAIERYLLLRSSAPGADGEPVLHVALGHGDAAGAIDPLIDIIERLRPNAQVELVGRVGPRLIQQIGTRCVAAAWLEPEDDAFDAAST